MKHISRRDFVRALFGSGVGLVAACTPLSTTPILVTNVSASATLTTTPTPLPTASSPPTATSSATLNPTETPSISPSSTSAPSTTPAPTATPEPTATSKPTTAPSRPPTPINPIHHVVVFLQENHTFDSLFAGFPGADGQSAGKPCPDALPGDPSHQHADALAPNGVTTASARCSYSEAQAPNYWKIAREFTLCDHFFSDVRGPSHPNYLMLVAGQSPILNTPWPSDECPNFCLDLVTIAQRLDARGLTWRDYAGIFTDIKGLVGRREVMDNGDAAFFQDAAQGTLPDVAWLNSGFLTDGNSKSGHPPASLCAGENYAVDVLNAVMKSPQWNSTALFMVWDDWGGFYDHVPPPVVERAADGSPFRYGWRVPGLVISPYARRGYVSHQLHSFVSILHYIEVLYGIAPLTFRDANADTMLDCFDYAQTPRPPVLLTRRACG